MIVVVPVSTAIGGVQVTEQLPETRVQEVPEKVPPMLALKVTVPVGSIALPLSVSVAVAVQVVLAG